MTTKLFEIRDRVTFIPALATRLGSETEPERYLLSRAGYGGDNSAQSQYILLTMLEGTRTTYDEFAWGSARTMQIAHSYIKENFDALQSGDVIDVEYILRETDQPKISERLEYPTFSLPHDEKEPT